MSHPRTVRPSLDFERALRLAATGHRLQERKGSGVPYIEHPLAVALILDRSGFDEAVVIAGLLHDLVEDTDVTLDQVRSAFGDRVAAIVSACSEVKLDPDGAKRPWIDRKRDQIDEVSRSGLEVRAVVLADKMHNLVSIRLDLLEGRPIWETFHAGREQVLWYYAAMLDACDSAEPGLADLLGECRALLAEVADAPLGFRKSGPVTT